MSPRRTTKPATGKPKGGTTTINDIARMAGVSKKTVSRVLNRSPLVRPETREKVSALMREHGISEDQAYHLLRRTAMNRKTKLANVARDFLTRTGLV